MMNLIRTVVPHFFIKEPIRDVTNPELKKVIDEVKHTEGVEKAIRKALDVLADRYEAKRFKTYTHFFKWFETDPNKLWQRRGFMHCTQLNYLFRVIMVKSGKLKDAQIRHGYSLVWYVSPHQFLKVYLKRKIVVIDPWLYDWNKTYNEYLRGFGTHEL